jgi:hypothetical protein
MATVSVSKHDQVRFTHKLTAEGDQSARLYHECVKLRALQSGCGKRTVLEEQFRHLWALYIGPCLAGLDQQHQPKVSKQTFRACALVRANPPSASSLVKGRPRAPVAERYVGSRLNGAEERTMPDFRCHMLDERGDILFPADLTVDTVEAAILHAFDILRTSNEHSSSRHVYAVEVWSGSSRLFPPELRAGHRAGQGVRSDRGAAAP